MDCEEPWTVLVTLRSIIHSVTGTYEDGVIRQFLSFDCEGVVLSDKDTAVKGTSVFMSILSGNDEVIEKLQREERSIGTAVVAKNAARIRDISTEPSRPMAGIDIKLFLAKTQFNDLRDSLSLNTQLPMSFEFRCLGDTLKQRSPFGPPTLTASDQDHKLRIVYYNVRFLVTRTTN